MHKPIYLTVNFPEQGGFTEDDHMEHVIRTGTAARDLLHVVTGRRILVWSSAAAGDMQQWIKHAADKFDADAAAWTRRREAWETDEKLFAACGFSHAVFVGGGQKAVDECRTLLEMQPDAAILPVTVTGGSTGEIAEMADRDLPEFRRFHDPIGIFQRWLGINVKEIRRRPPKDK